MNYKEWNKWNKSAKQDGFSDWRDEIGTLVVSKPIDGNNVNDGHCEFNDAYLQLDHRRDFAMIAESMDGQN